MQRNGIPPGDRNVHVKYFINLPDDVAERYNLPPFGVMDVRVPTGMVERGKNGHYDEVFRDFDRDVVFQYLATKGLRQGDRTRLNNEVIHQNRDLGSFAYQVPWTVEALSAGDRSRILPYLLAIEIAGKHGRDFQYRRYKKLARLLLTQAKMIL